MHLVNEMEILIILFFFGDIGPNVVCYVSIEGFRFMSHNLHPVSVV